jgi:hypothetical protein
VHATVAHLHLKSAKRALRIADACPGSNVELPAMPRASNDGLLVVEPLAESPVDHLAAHLGEDSPRSDGSALVRADRLKRKYLLADPEHPDSPARDFDDQAAA